MNLHEDGTRLLQPTSAFGRGVVAAAAADQVRPFDVRAAIVARLLGTSVGQAETWLTFADAPW